MIYSKILSNGEMIHKIDFIKKELLLIIEKLEYAPKDMNYDFIRFRETYQEEYKNFIKLLMSKSEYNNIITLLLDSQRMLTNNNAEGPFMSEVLSLKSYTNSLADLLIENITTGEANIHTLSQLIINQLSFGGDFYNSPVLEKIAYNYSVSSYIAFLRHIEVLELSVTDEVKLLNIFYENNTQLMQHKNYMEFRENYPYLSLITTSEITVAKFLLYGNSSHDYIYSVIDASVAIEMFFEVKMDKLLILFNEKFGGEELYCRVICELHNIYDGGEEKVGKRKYNNFLDIDNLIKVLEDGQPVDWGVELSLFLDEG